MCKNLIGITVILCFEKLKSEYLKLGFWNVMLFFDFIFLLPYFNWNFILLRSDLERRGKLANKKLLDFFEPGG